MEEERKRSGRGAEEFVGHPHEFVAVERRADEVAAGTQTLARVAQHRVRLAVTLERVVQRELAAGEVELERLAAAGGVDVPQARL